MISLGGRIEELRSERALSRAALCAELNFPKNAIEKFETGRQTPTKAQQERMAEYFGVSLLYLRGETNDRTRMSTWMEEVPDEPADELPAAVKKAAATAKKQKEPKPEGGILDGLLATDQVKSLLRDIVLETLRSPEGQAAIRKALK